MNFSSSKKYLIWEKKILEKENFNSFLMVIGISLSWVDIEISSPFLDGSQPTDAVSRKELGNDHKSGGSFSCFV